MTFERILSHFQVRKCGTGKAQCICPAHADREASLTLTDGNDRALIKCHAGCSTEEVVIAAGLKMSDLFYGDGLAKERWRAYIENREKRKIEAVYNYASINGDYAYTKVRLEFINFSPLPHRFDQIYRLLIDSSSTPCSRRFTSVSHGFDWSNTEKSAITPDRISHNRFFIEPQVRQQDYY